MSGFDEARTWCQGRRPELRLLLLLFLAWAGWRQFQDWEFYHIYSGLTLGFHEMGHILFSPFGETLMIAGGSITQLAIPMLVAVMLYRQGDFYGVAVGGTLLASSMANLAVYIGDARAEELPLVGFSDDPEHDWNWLLDHFHALSSDTRIAGLVKAGGMIVFLASLWLGFWLCWQMWRTRPRSA
ncbi:MAG: hypothetical protein ABI765_08795 [Gemmatimonadota bacterium]